MWRNDYRQGTSTSRISYLRPTLKVENRQIKDFDDDYFVDCYSNDDYYSDDDYRQGTSTLKMPHSRSTLKVENRRIKDFDDYFPNDDYRQGTSTSKISYSRSTLKVENRRIKDFDDGYFVDCYSNDDYYSDDDYRQGTSTLKMPHSRSTLKVENRRIKDFDDDYFVDCYSNDDYYSDDDYRRGTSTLKMPHSSYFRSTSKMMDQRDNRGSIDSITEQLRLTSLRNSGNWTDGRLSSKPIHSKSPSKVNYSKRMENMDLEKKYFEEFSVVNPFTNLREGTKKTSFNYLLLDPRITEDLPSRAKNLAYSEVRSTFQSSIFYVGKGIRKRPYRHLEEASRVWKSSGRSEDKKIQRILSIWRKGYGVICSHIYQNTIPIEAYTREAAMIDALGVKNLTNHKRGSYYGTLASKEETEKRKVGTYLLNKAMQIYLLEGEREIFPDDI